MSCGLLFLHTRPPFLCSPTHRLLRIKPDLQVFLSVLVSSPLSKDCQPCDEHSHRQGYQADLLVEPYRWWVQTRLRSPVLTDGTADLAWRWAAYWAAASDLQGLFFPNYCKWLHLFYCKQLLFFFFLAVPVTLVPRQQRYPHPEHRPRSQVTTACLLSRQFPSSWHLFTWFCASCTLSCFSRWIFRA